MEDLEQPRNLRRTLMRDTVFIFIGFVFIILCFVFLGIAQQQQHIIEEHCEDCHGSNNPRVFRLLAAICFIFGFTIMTVFWWHVKAIKNAYVLRQRRLELERLLGNVDQPGRRASRLSLGKRNSGWYGHISTRVNHIYYITILCNVKLAAVNQLLCYGPSSVTRISMSPGSADFGTFLVISFQVKTCPLVEDVIVIRDWHRTYNDSFVIFNKTVSRIPWPEVFLQSSLAVSTAAKGRKKTRFSIIEWKRVFFLVQFA